MKQEISNERIEGNFSLQKFTDIHYEECEFIGCRFQSAVFLRCLFQSCTFTRCDLSLAQLTDSRMQEVRFEDCKLVGVDWTLLQWPKIRSLPPVFHNSVLNHGTFMALQLHGLTMTQCTCHEADFRESELDNAIFSGTDFAGSMFHHTRMVKADFRSARNYQINPAENQLKGAKFTLPEALALLYAMEIDMEE